MDACAETDQEFVWVYRCQAEGPFQLHPDEIERGEWFAPEAVTRWMAEKPEDFASAFRLIWSKMYSVSSTSTYSKSNKYGEEEDENEVDDDLRDEVCSFTCAKME